MQIPGAFPAVLKVWRISASPLAFLFAGRILWEKTIWTWSRGPQMVGFALWHIHPGPAVAGTLCSLAVAPWLLIAIPYAIMRRSDIEPWDWLMMALPNIHDPLTASVPWVFTAFGRQRRFEHRDGKQISRINAVLLSLCPIGVTLVYKFHCQNRSTKKKQCY